MFYCEACRKENRWPGVVPVSLGNCEVCKNMNPCYDYPSYMLPNKVDDDADNILKDIIDNG